MNPRLMLSQEPTTFLPCIRRRRYTPMKRKVEAQEMGQRHRFSSGVKSPSSPFGHFCYTSWTSGSCIQCVQSLRHHTAGCSREGFKPPVEDSPFDKSKHPKATGLRWMFFDSEHCYLPFNLKLESPTGFGPVYSAWQADALTRLSYRDIENEMRFEDSYPHYHQLEMRT